MCREQETGGGGGGQGVVVIHRLVCRVSSCEQTARYEQVSIESTESDSLIFGGIGLQHYTYSVKDINCELGRSRNVHVQCPSGTLLCRNKDGECNGPMRSDQPGENSG